MGVVRNLLLRVGADVSGLQKSLASAQKNFEKSARQFKKVGETLTKSISLPIIGAGLALSKMTLNAAKAADDLVTLSNVTGISTTRLQTMSFAAGQLGMELSTITDAQTRLARAMYEAHTGNERMIRNFHELGVIIYDADGKLRDINDVFWDVLESMEGIEEQAVRDGLAMELLGRSARELNPIIKAGREEFERLESVMRDLGWVLSEAEQERLNKLSAEFKIFQGGLKNLGQTIAMEFIPVMEKLFEVFKEAFPQVKNSIHDTMNAFKNLSPEVQKALGVLAALAVALPPLALLVSVVMKTMSVLGTVISVALSPFVLKLAAVLFIAYGAFRLVQAAVEDTESVVYKAIDKMLSKIIQFRDTIMGLIDKIKEFLGLSNSVAETKLAELNDPNNINRALIKQPAVVPESPKINFQSMQIPKMAKGGILTQPTLNIAGEAGPEAIMPLSKMGELFSTTVQVILDGRVIQEYIDNGLGNQLSYGR